jgi:hypothetical protein
MYNYLPREPNHAFPGTIKPDNFENAGLSGSKKYVYE